MWFSEGLAHFMETVATAPVADAPATGTHLLRGQRAPARSVGLASERLQASVAVVQPVPARDLLSWTGSESETDSGRYHFWSWLLYHWLWNTRSKDFAAFQQRLAEAQDPAAAWLASFPDLDPSRPEAMSRMDDRLEAYRRDGRYLSYRVEAQADAAFTREPLGPADVHMLLLDARAAWPEGKAREALYAAEVQEALGEDPSQPSAIQARARLAKSSPAAPLRQAIAARPGDWRAWLLLGDSLGDAEAAEKEAAYRKATSLNPDGALAQNNLAWLLAKAGRAREALHFANRAADLAPRSPEVLDTLAFVAADLGKCPEALTLQQRAVALLAPGSGAPIRQNLAEYQKRCASRVAR
jgi:Flp pilus assembly protein TadD